jgi:hypothetical protein
MRRKIWVSLIVLAVISAACMPKAQPEPEAVMPEPPQAEEQPVEVEEPVVAEEASSTRGRIGSAARLCRSLLYLQRENRS